MSVLSEIQFREMYFKGAITFQKYDDIENIVMGEE